MDSHYVPEAATHEQQWAEANEELVYRLEQALRSCLSHGVLVDDIRLLCSATGITYSQVTGDNFGTLR